MNRDQDFCLSEEPLIGYFSARAAASQNQISYRGASAKWALNWLWRFFKKDSTVNLSFTFGWIYPIELCFSKRRRFISQKVVQGDQDHFLSKEMLISPSILKLHKNP